MILWVVGVDGAGGGEVKHYKYMKDCMQSAAFKVASAVNKFSMMACIKSSPEWVLFRP